ncbi:hypothetical protein E4U42_003483 [Claviceps africana]|uniref:Prp 4 CRoW domain-containing protein n=1 Tax=Claviceps africana TaxID=83212 RepID=A0A8K0J6T4_9HYPO|nr:hypothetical protein E4U42_003483 [Claviceps africana]
MLFRTVTSLALLATAASAASPEAKRQPYRLAVMAVPGRSLMRRDDGGYKPDQKQCKAGNTCAEACGAGFDQCPGGQPDIAHCFNPTVGQSCCTDNSGNSCDAGFYCTHDARKQTWCCPHELDLAACAAAFKVDGLVAATAKPAPTTTSTTSTTSSATPSSTAHLTTTTHHLTTTSTSTSTTTTTTTSPTSTTPCITTTSSIKSSTTSAHSTTVATHSTTVAAHNSTLRTNSTTRFTASVGTSTAFSRFNTTMASLTPTQPSDVTPLSTHPAPTTTKPNAAAASGVSALLLVAAGFIALL